MSSCVKGLACSRPSPEKIYCISEIVGKEHDYWYYKTLKLYVNLGLNQLIMSRIGQLCPATKVYLYFPQVKVRFFFSFLFS